MSDYLRHTGKDSPMSSEDSFVGHIPVTEEDVQEQQKNPNALTVSIHEASHISGFSYQTIYRAVRSGQLKSKLPHGASKGRRIFRKDLVAWLNELD